MNTQEYLVYAETWYLAVNEPPSKQLALPPLFVPGSSPFRCDFGELSLPVLDWHVSGSDRTPVRVVVYDDPDFFNVLAESDRQFLLHMFAIMLYNMVKSGQARLQYGIAVQTMDGRELSPTWHVEYHISLIRTDFAEDAEQSRYIANIWSGQPPKKLCPRRKESDS